MPSRFTKDTVRLVFLLMIFPPIGVEGDIITRPGQRRYRQQGPLHVGHLEGNIATMTFTGDEVQLDLALVRDAPTVRRKVVHPVPRSLARPNWMVGEAPFGHDGRGSAGVHRDLHLGVALVLWLPGGPSCQGQDVSIPIRLEEEWGEVRPRGNGPMRNEDDLGGGTCSAFVGASG